MRFIFRADASLQIGTGHVMRCLTLAGALEARGAECRFVCREYPGNLIDLIASKGFNVHVLPAGSTNLRHDCKLTPTTEEAGPSHLHWLGATQAQDAEACAPILSEWRPDWLITDHYALDARWGRALKRHYRRLMVIDDLADRPHACDLLLDQTYGRSVLDYQPLVPAGCQLLCGSQYALLRPEFAAYRPYSLQRRSQPTLQHLLITMGGVDKDNFTGQVLEALCHTKLPDDCRISVVIGPASPWLAQVQEFADSMPYPTEVLVNVTDMARLMANSDLAIGAAGSTSWERCCLGLPTIMIVTAQNQLEVARSLARAGAAWTIEMGEVVTERLPEILASLISNPAALLTAARLAACVSEGRGTGAVCHALEA